MSDKITIPSRSREMYERAYIRFITWAKEQQVNDFTENAVLAYFVHLSNKSLKSSSMWAQFSMLKVELSIKDNVDINCYKRVRAFLKRKSENYTAKKSKSFTKDQVDTFLREAPDKKYLAMKVVLIYGITGACRCNELINLRIQDMEFLEKFILVKIPNTKVYKSRSYTIVGDFYIDICKKYLSLRPEGVKTDRFFIKYQNGVCHRVVMGIHKISSIPKETALFLKLKDPKAYTGTSFRRTSTTLLVENSEAIGSTNREGGGRPRTVADSSINDTLRNKNDIARKILNVNDCNLTLENIKTENTGEPAILATTKQQTLNINCATKGQAIKLLQNCTFENCTINVMIHSSDTNQDSD